jgi:hypothetical protein
LSHPASGGEQEVSVWLEARAAELAVEDLELVA